MRRVPFEAEIFSLDNEHFRRLFSLASVAGEHSRGRFSLN